MVLRKSVPKRRVAKRKGNRKSRVPKHLTPKIPQFSKVVESISIQDMESNLPYQRTFSLNDFNRARYESVNWQFFKANRVTYTYEPLYNTYQDGNDNTALSAPYLYQKMNRTQDNEIPLGLGDLQGMGAMPRKLTNTHKFSYKPNWCTQGLTAVASQGAGVYALGAKTEYGWINNSSHDFTQASPTTRNAGVLIPDQAGAVGTILNAQTVHQLPSYCLYNGHDDFIDQKFAGTSPNQVICRVTITVEWHFKSPMYNGYISVTNTAPTVTNAVSTTVPA